MKNRKELKRKARHQHILKKIKKGIAEVPRIVVRKSNKNIYVTLVDDKNLKVLTGCVKSRKEASAAGLLISEKAKKLGIEKVIFDRAGYKYHGIVKAVADGARGGGLKF
ncbi:MAG: 50S ribosomal protein L18 [Elusimicrobia bacterium CG08_land_8_20_14_0_20_44_26]|nr:MAG: 50S ribosomal protein L18 [Elusimicrobia bacterium CG08_land_8_20_14_0_20_44_26]